MYDFGPITALDFATIGTCTGQGQANFLNYCSQISVAYHYISLFLIHDPNRWSWLMDTFPPCSDSETQVLSILKLGPPLVRGALSILPVCEEREKRGLAMRGLGVVHVTPAQFHQPELSSMATGRHRERGHWGCWRSLALGLLMVFNHRETAKCSIPRERGRSQAPRCPSLLGRKLGVERAEEFS